MDGENQLQVDDFMENAQFVDDYDNPVESPDITNDLGVKSLDIIIKLIECNGHPVAKITDEPGKIIYVDREFYKYLKKVFNVK